jgi:hypothetical protein
MGVMIQDSYPAGASSPEIERLGKGHLAHPNAALVKTTEKTKARNHTVFLAPV